MTDDMTPIAPEDEPAGDAGAGAADPEAAGSGDSRSAQAREWLTQLQAMIDRIAHEAEPLARQVAAKAAELAAVAGEKAGPFAKRAAEVTGDVGTRVAERGRKLADDLRHTGADGHEPAEAPAAPADEEPGTPG